MPKYKEYFKRMVDANQSLFDNFQKLHDEYTLNPDRLQKKFNQEGEKVLRVMREWENKLCSQSEKGGYGHFTTSLAEKFQNEIRKNFPKIDSVGIIVESSKPALKKIFNLKRIRLS